MIENDEVIDPAQVRVGHFEKLDFDAMILDHLRTSGVQQAHKEDRISFASIVPWPGDLVGAEGVYYEGEEESARLSGAPQSSSVPNSELSPAPT